MKKRKLLFAAAMLLFSAGAWAQTDVTDTYLTNASVASTDGWTGDGEVGVAIANDANWTGRPDDVCLNHGWNTTATNMYQTVTLPAGNYRLVVMTRGSENINSNIYAYDTANSTNLASAEVTKNGDTGDNNGWGETTVEFMLTTSKQVQIGWWCTNTGNYEWANADYFKLYRLPVDPTAITLNESSLSMIPTATKTLSVTYTPNYANHNIAITWESSDPSVATVANGVVTAVVAGTATITATTANNISTTCTVTVNPAPIANGDYYLYNEGAGMYVVGANEWGTRASMETSGIKMTATLSDGKYTLSTAPTYTGKYLGADGYVDQGSVGWYLIPASGDGYILQCSSNSKYLVWDGGSATTTSMTETLPTDSKGYWTFKSAAERLAVLETATKASPKEATYLIANPDFSREANLGLWTSTSSNSGEFKVGGGYDISNNLQQWNGYCTVYQNVTNLPNGLYKMTVQGFYRPGNANTTSTAQNVTIYAGEEEKLLMLHTNGAPNSEDAANGFTANSGLGSWVPNSQTDASKAFTAGYYVNEVDNILTTNGTIQIGATNTTPLANQWMVLDNFRLYYYGPTISSIATSLPDGSLIVDTWYYFDVAVDGYYDLAVTTLSDVVYTMDAKVLVEDGSDVTTNFAETTALPLTAGRYYIKSASAQSFAVAPHAYTYVVGDATLSSADDSYTQNSTFTVTFPDAATNDPSASAALVVSSKATVNGADVALSAVTNGFSLDLGSLTTNSDYVIAIPAGVYGYADESMNSAINITLHTPVAFDGEYCLYEAANSLFLGSGCQYGTEASVDKYGIPFNLVTDATGTSSIEFVDRTGVYLFITDGSIYTDNASTGWRLVPATGGYYLRDYGLTIYAKHSPGTNGEHVYTTATEGEATVWTLKTKTERDAIVNAYPTDNKNNVITAAGISTTAAEFETYLSDNYTAVDCTSKIGTATFAGSVGDWTWTGTWKTEKGQPAYGNNFAEVWNATGNFTQTIDKANLPAGIYKVTVQGFERRKGSDAATALYEAGYNLVSTYLSVNGEQVRFTDWNEVDGKPNNTSGAVTAFGEGKAVNEVYVYLDGNTDLELTVRKPNYIWDCWIIMNNFTLTRYMPVESVTVTDAGYATYASDLNLDFTSSGIKAYIATTKGDGTGVNFTQINKVPAGTGILLYKDGGTTENIPVFDDTADDTAGNVFVRGTGAGVATDDGTNYNYILNNGTSGIGFYKANNQIVATNRAYIRILKSETPALVKGFIELPCFDDDATGIDATGIEAIDNEIYNLAGQRMSKMQKGINIVNGKKIMK